MRTSQKIYLLFKRLIAIIGSFTGIVFCLGLFWWWILIINLFVTKGHPFFISQRIGKNGKSFGLIKFRSMRLDADPKVSSLKQSYSYCTKFGKFLRITSLDETPQLFNIFVGQMAFVGPRPLIDVDDDAVTIQERKNNGSIVLRPGLTGYAQLHRREMLEPLIKAKYDLEYYQKFSLWFDIKIFVLTILVVFGYKPKEQ